MQEGQSFTGIFTCFRVRSVLVHCSMIARPLLAYRGVPPWFTGRPKPAGDRLYVPNQNADVFVVRAGPKFECLATNSIGGEPMNASLAVADGALFLRTHRHLWCVAEAPPR